MFDFFSKRKREEKKRLAAAHETGRKIGSAVTSAIDRYADARFAEVKKKVLDIFREQLLKSINDHPEHAPSVLAEIEMEFLVENLEKNALRLKNDVHAFLRVSEWMDELEKIDGTDMFDKYIELKISGLHTSVTAEARWLVVEAISKALLKEQPAGRGLH